MDQIDNFYGYFNLLLGTIFILIGFKIYKPFKKDREEEIYKKYINLYRFGGIGLVIWGLVKIL
jgi:hypothetical protein